MSKKETRISINKLESTMKEKTVTIPLNGVDGVEIVIRRSLPLMSVMQFVEDVVSSVIDKENGSYIPEVKEFAIHSAVLTQYANFNLPKSAESQYDLIYNTDALDQVMGVINGRQFNEILDAIDRRIEHELSIIENAVAVRSHDLLQKFDDMVEKFDSMVSGISSEEFGSIMKNIASMQNIDEKSLAQAVLGIKNNPDEKVVVFPKPEE